MNDLIDRHNAIYALIELPLDLDAKTVQRCIEAISNLSAQPERKKGQWIEITPPDEDGNALYQCSVCKKGETHTPIVKVSYCWNCGADMRGEQDDDD